MKEDNKREKKNKRTRDADVVRQPPPLLVQCSSSWTSTSGEEKKKNKQQQQREQFGPPTITITRSISKSRTITITPPPEEDPEMSISIYLCIQFNSDPDDRMFRWCVIYPTNSPYLQSEPEPIFLYPISYMPATTPTDIHLVASPFSGPPYSNKMKNKNKNKNKDRKVVYAVGGLSNANDPHPYGCRSSKAFVCDLGTISAAWEELPPMSSPKLIHIGAVSTSDGKLYVFGHAAEGEELPSPIHRSRTITRVEDRKEDASDSSWEDASDSSWEITSDSSSGDVFDPSSRSWTPCPPPDLPLSCVDDYTFDKEKNELVVFTNHEDIQTFDPTNTHEQCVITRTVHFSPTSDERVSSCVVVGDTIYKFHLGELYALDRNSKSPSLE
ncbi:hypothetical protein LguiB_005605 [Lonicera macranthoides]